MATYCAACNQPIAPGSMRRDAKGFPYHDAPGCWQPVEADAPCPTCGVLPSFVLQHGRPEPSCLCSTVERKPRPVADRVRRCLDRLDLQADEQAGLPLADRQPALRLMEAFHNRAGWIERNTAPGRTILVRDLAEHVRTLRDTLAEHAELAGGGS